MIQYSEPKSLTINKQTMCFYPSNMRVLCGIVLQKQAFLSLGYSLDLHSSEFRTNLYASRCESVADVTSDCVEGEAAMARRRV